MQSLLYGIGEYLTPVLKDSKFKENGVLTPDEFVAAGDFLVFKCPTWTWEAGLEAKRRPFLPGQKQFLMTRNVPCYRRASELETEDTEEERISLGADANGKDAGGSAGDEDWIATHRNFQSLRIGAKQSTSKGEEEEEDEIQDMEDELDAMKIVEGSSSKQHAVTASPKTDHEEDDEEIPDMEDFGDMDNMVEEDPATLPSTAKATTSNATTTASKHDNIMRFRTYDMYISYDKYYQTPRMWLFGYDENRIPLSPEQIFEDISQDHAKKTVTIESFPHLNASLLSIHPCRHASVMKRIMERMEEAKGSSTKGNPDELRVDQYLTIFLKFMSCVVPTIDYDHTVAVKT